ncbi:MAG: hypothetical protein JSV05_07835 [Candidatus Bathyarchaeota archaeon]|nr:MAG: hypothetical protein JSV05_07835 [Candidatus Bathyarchaeota archaeon]
MISALELLLGLIAGIVIMVRWRLVPAFVRQRIYDKLQARLKVSTPHLRSTFDGVSIDSGSSTSR